MGTYTTNKNLFMPTVGETGWGTLVNNNFETIDNFLKPISLSGSTYTFTGNQTGGTITATSITNSGTLTSTGKITANGGIGTKTVTATGVTVNGNATITGTLNVNENISGSFGMSVVDSTEYISGVFFNSEIILASGSYSNNYYDNPVPTVKSIEYAKNPISNNVVFVASRTSDYSTAKAQAIIKINGETIADTGNGAWGNTITTDAITMNDGDVIETSVYGKAGQGNTASATCKMVCKGYLLDSE